MDNLLCILVQNSKWVAALTVVKKNHFYLIFCLLRSLVRHIQNDKILIRKSLHSENPDLDHVLGIKITCFFHLIFLLWFMLQVDQYARPSSKLRPVIMSEKLQEK